MRVRDCEDRIWLTMMGWYRWYVLARKPTPEEIQAESEGNVTIEVQNF